MAGFSNDVVYGTNVDFTGTSPISGQINQNGELLVGASVAPFIRSHVPVGSSGVSIVVGPGTIDFSLANIPNSALQNSTITITAGPGLAGGGVVSLGGTVVLSATSTITTTQYDVLVGGASNTIVSVGPGSVGQVLQSGGNSANPAYSTATYPSTATGTGTILRADGTNWIATTSTYPATNAISTLLYASSANVMSALTTANNGLLVTSSTGVPSILAGPGTTGNILQSNSSAAPSFSTATYPATAGTSGNGIFSDGTNFVSALPYIIRNYTQGTGTITVGASNFISADPSGGAVTVKLPDAPTNYTWFIVKDRTGAAATHNITVTTASGTDTIDGSTTYVMNINYGSASFLWNGTSYEVF